MAARSNEARRGTRPTDQEIYSAAVRLFSGRGYHGTSLRSVAAAVGLQMSSLYYHYPSKQYLLFEIMNRTMQDLAAAVEEAVGESEGPQEKLRAAIRAHVLFHARRGMEAFIADAELRSLEAETRALSVKRRDRYQQIFEDILRDGAQQGVFDVPDVKLATYALMAMCTGVAVWFRPDGRVTLEEVADAYADLFVHGVMPSGDGRRGVGSREREPPGAGAVVSRPTSGSAGRQGKRRGGGATVLGV